METPQKRYRTRQSVAKTPKKSNVSNSDEEEEIFDAKKPKTRKSNSSKNPNFTPKKYETQFAPEEIGKSGRPRRTVSSKIVSMKEDLTNESESEYEEVGLVMLQNFTKMGIISPKKDISKTTPSKNKKSNLKDGNKKVKKNKDVSYDEKELEESDSDEEYNPEQDFKNSSETCSEQENEEPNSPKSKSLRNNTPKLKKNFKHMLTTPVKSSVKTPLKKQPFTPSMHQRMSNILKPSTPLQEARSALHVSAVPKSLPCREEEFNNIFTFLKTRLTENSGGCIYVSGVPGTGKTATVNEIIKCLNKCVKNKTLQEFDFVDINGMKLSEPHQAYVQIYKQLSGETRPWEEAQNLLNTRFTTASSKKSMTLLLVDELDMLCTKRQDVVYNLLDWPSKTNAKLLVITIANTMDLPERSLMGRVTSRLGLTRVTFHPYDFKQLQEIVLSRLKTANSFNSDAVQFVSRKVASVSGDARRALDICRRATEIAEENGNIMVTMKDVNQALSEMIANVKVQAIKNCSLMEQYFLKAICSEVNRTGIEEVIFKNVYQQLKTCCTFDGEKVPNVSQALGICSRLSSWRLILCEHSQMDIFQRIILNVSPDDINFALNN